MSLVARMKDLLQAQPPGQWFDVTDEHMADVHRLQIALHQASGRLPNVASVTTRNASSGLVACWFPRDVE